MPRRAYVCPITISIYTQYARCVRQTSQPTNRPTNQPTDQSVSHVYIYVRRYVAGRVCMYVERILSTSLPLSRRAPKPRSAAMEYWMVVLFSLSFLPPFLFFLPPLRSFLSGSPSHHTTSNPPSSLTLMPLSGISSSLQLLCPSLPPPPPLSLISSAATSS